MHDTALGWTRIIWPHWPHPYGYPADNVYPDAGLASLGHTLRRMQARMCMGVLTASVAAATHSWTTIGQVRRAGHAQNVWKL
jgi:hypothetical protein